MADLHHGYANGVMIDHALKFNLESPRPSASRAWPTRSAWPTDARGLPGLAARPQGELGIPAGLAAAGVGGAELDRLARLAFEDPAT